MKYTVKELKNISKSLKYWNVSPEQKACVNNLINMILQEVESK